MKIALTSDLHIFLTKEKHIKTMFQKMVSDAPDVLVIAGDHSGTHDGARGTLAVFKMARSVFPSTPIVACLGNHDYWIRGRKVGGRFKNPSLYDFETNYSSILKHAETYDIHLLEEDGIFRHPEISGVAIIGHGLWYKMPPNSNDANFLPIGINGDTHRYLYKTTTDALLKQLESVDPVNDTTLVCVTHFPILDISDADASFCGDPFIGEMLKDDYGCKIFINGHSHRNADGPTRWECGSDYYDPKYKIINV